MLRRLTKDQVQARVTAYQAGDSISCVARRYHVRFETARRWLTKVDIPVRPIKIGIPPESAGEAVALRQTGWSWKQLGQHFGCSHTSARRAVLTYYATTDPGNDVS
jgi:hypothetical protein